MSVFVFILLKVLGYAKGTPSA